MAYCDECGNNDSIIPNLYYYWDYPLEEDYDWRAARPEHDCLCEICFDILNEEGKIKWKECASSQTVQ